MLSVAVRDRAVFLPAADALVVADLHVGRADASDVDFPLGERTDLADRLTALVAEFDPHEVVFAGDLLHRFDRVSERSVSALETLAETCTDAGATPVFVAGNHDTMLAESWSGDVHDEYRLADETLVSHGHCEPDGESHLYVVGHDHPMLTIEGRTRPCVLYGPGAYRGSDVLMLPSFTRLAAGVEINRMRGSDFQSPLVRDASVFRPFVRDDDAGETLTFPPLGKLRRLL
ncbi:MULTISPECIES: metallophosphoesterase [Haloferax]|uniref:Metallophosphoesterase n=2 Tax=Haloferax TaxID=2251 RepID=A0A6G1Z5J6_9EURY|nr:MULTISPECIES: metallophosphoesterase [Haloferax]KAB1189297.1 metallophosphoesterase [Haloferax sp. CBA1149]MRW81839.1 metallophosphoesterase [Haloferax marinisediminis]